MPISPRFEVRNLGPIEEGSVDLHPLTILIGKNNTGKTYMAQAIYAAYKALEFTNGRVEPRMADEEVSDFVDLLHLRSEQEVDVLRGGLRQKAEKWMHSRLRRAGRAMGSRLLIYFDLDEMEELKRWQGEGPLDISVKLSDGSDTGSWFLFGLGSGDGLERPPLPWVAMRDMGTSLIPRFDDLMIRFSVGDPNYDKKLSLTTSVLESRLWNGPYLASIGLDGIAHYLPAGRSGLLEAWTDVVRLRLQQDRDRLGLEGRDPAAVGGIALDFLLQLQGMIPGRRRFRSFPHRFIGDVLRSPMDSIATGLEAMIGGEVDFARGRERVPSLMYTQGRNSIPVQRASSMVAELAPLLTWIRRLLVPGDLILIDEPEAHMHPEAVLAVAQTLVALAGSGVRVVCTTHSSEFLHQVSNCMLRAASQGIGSDGETDRIDVDDIGVYRFIRTEQGSGTRIVREEIDPEWGIPEDEYIAVAEYLGEQTADLVDNLT